MSTDDEEEMFLAADHLERPAQVSRSDLIPLVNSQQSILEEIKELKEEVTDIVTKNKNTKLLSKDIASNLLSDDASSSSLQQLNQESIINSEHNIPATQSLNTTPLTNIDSTSYTKLLNILDKIQLLEDKWSKIDDTLDKLSNRINDVDQYGRLYNLKIKNVAGVPTKLKGLPFSRYVAELLNRLFCRHLICPIHVNDIDISHPLYRMSNGNHVIIVRFVRRDVRDAIFYKREILAHTNSGIHITEHLTAENTRLLKSAEKTLGKEKVWTEQCKIYTLLKGKRVLIKNESSITDILSKTIDIPVDEHIMMVDTTINNSGEKVTNSTASNTNSKPAANNGRIVSKDYRANKAKGNRYGVDFREKSDWPSLLQTIDYQAFLKGPMPYHTSQNRFPISFANNDNSYFNLSRGNNRVVNRHHHYQHNYWAGNNNYSNYSSRNNFNNYNNH